VVRRGDIWWMQRADEKARPVLVVTRDEAIGVLRRVVVAPVTTTLRQAPSQLALGSAEGLPVDCAANFDDLAAVSKALLVRRIGSLGLRLHELCATLTTMAGC
jgi:mRNA interferase MazF